MKNLLTCILIYLAFHLLLPAQDVTWGAENKSDRSDFNPKRLLGIYNNSLYVTMREKKKYYIQRYGIKDNLKMGKEVLLPEEIGKDDIDYQFSYRIKNMIHTFFTKYSKKEKKNTIFVQSYDENLSPKGSLRELMSIGGRNRSERGSFDLLVSTDSTKICLMGEDDFKDKDPQKYSFTVFNSYSMEEDWRKSVTLPYTDKIFKTSDFDISNEGSVYIFGKKYNNNKVKEKKGGKVNYTFEVFGYSKTAADIQKTISLGDLHYMRDMKMFVSKNNNINIVGFFGERSNIDRSKGIFTLSFDKEMNITKKNQADFSPEFLENFGRWSKQRGELKEFDIKSIAENDNGTFKVIAEQSFVIVQRNRNQSPLTINIGGSSDIYTYYDLDIIAFDLDKDLKISNMQKISKSQVSRNIQEIHSYITYQNGSDLSLLYNDNVKNKDVIDGKKIKEMGSKPSFFMVKLGGDGTVKKDLLFGKQENKFLIYPKFSQQISPKEVIIYAERGRKYSFGIIKFD